MGRLQVIDQTMQACAATFTRTLRAGPTKALLLSALVLAPRAAAEVLECPKIYPLADTTLAKISSDPNGIGRLTRGHLSFAYMYFGKLFGEQYFKPAHENWLVCIYGGSSWGAGDIERWEKLAPATTACKLDVREIKSRRYSTKYTASAVCK
jgi:hypothetical protein